jgi:hypothetical protein
MIRGGVTNEYLSWLAVCTVAEKNWGASFPDSWIWAEGIKLNANPDTYFALAGGPTKIFGPLVVTAYLAGYRSPNLNWNFHPQDPSCTLYSSCHTALHVNTSSCAYL